MTLKSSIVLLLIACWYQSNTTHTHGDSGYRRNVVDPTHLWCWFVVEINRSIARHLKFCPNNKNSQWLECWSISLWFHLKSPKKQTKTKQKQVKGDFGQKKMAAATRDVETELKRRVAYLPGGRDRSGQPIIVVPIDPPPAGLCAGGVSSSNHGHHSQSSAHHNNHSNSNNSSSRSTQHANQRADLNDSFESDWRLMTRGEEERCQDLDRVLRYLLPIALWVHAKTTLSVHFEIPRLPGSFVSFKLVRFNSRWETGLIFWIVWFCLVSIFEEIGVAGNSRPLATTYHDNSSLQGILDEMKTDHFSRCWKTNDCCVLLFWGRFEFRFVIWRRGSSATKSVVVLMDARQGCWRLLRASTEQVQITLANHLAAIWALKPEPFWEKQHVECVKSRQDCKVFDSFH